MLININDWKTLRSSEALKSKSIGFVPTMGNLHEGHASLLKQSADENDITVLSIFVNPTQFNNESDLENYPRTLENDVELAKQCGVNYILNPSYDELYPYNYRFKISENQISSILEGDYRPGHFDGVLTVVLKLLLLVKPSKAYFGEKDYQQLQLIKDLTRAFFVDSEIISCKTVRNEDGLALSSRNNLLTSEQLQQATLFPKLLQSSETCEKISEKLIEAGFDVDYVTEYQGRRFGAVHFGKVRLIDNVELC